MTFSQVAVINAKGELSVEGGRKSFMIMRDLHPSPPPFFFFLLDGSFGFFYLKFTRGLVKLRDSANEDRVMTLKLDTRALCKNRCKRIS